MSGKRQIMIGASYVSRHEFGEKYADARLDILSGEIFNSIPESSDACHDDLDYGQHESDFIAIPGHSMLYPVSTDIIDNNTLAIAFIESDILIGRIARTCQYSVSDSDGHCQCYFGAQSLYSMDADAIVKNTMTGSVKRASIILNKIPLREQLNEISRHAASVHAAMRYLSFVSINDDTQSIVEAMDCGDDQVFSEIGVIVRPQYEHIPLATIASMIRAAEQGILDAIKMVADNAAALSENQKPRVLVTVSGGKADYISDKNVSVEIFDFDNYSAGCQKNIPDNFADLAAQAGILLSSEADIKPKPPSHRHRT